MPSSGRVVVTTELESTDAKARKQQEEQRSTPDSQDHIKSKFVKNEEMRLDPEEVKNTVEVVEDAGDVIGELAFFFNMPHINTSRTPPDSSAALLGVQVR